MKARVYSKIKLSPNGPETLMSVCVDNTLHLSYQIGIGVQDFLRANRIFTQGQCDRSCQQEIIELPPQADLVMKRYRKNKEWSDIEWPTHTDKEIFDQPISKDKKDRMRAARKKRFNLP